MNQWLIVALVVLISACGGSSNANSVDTDSSGMSNDEQPATGSPNNGESQVPAVYGTPLASQIRPGVEITADGSACTGNFIFSPNNKTFYIGVAAHCFSADTNDGTDSCETNNLPIGYNQVMIENATQPGEIIYSSWRAMQEAGETPGSDACVYNDFALVKIHQDDIANVHPAAIAFGGPISLHSDLASVGNNVYAYGRSPYHLGLRALEAKSGSISAILGSGWAYEINTDNASIPGDSGGPIFGPNGEALAVTSVLSVGLGGLSLINISNGVVNLDRALQYAIDGGFINANTALITWPDFYPSGDF